MPLLSRLFGPKAPIGDVAIGDWDPVPVSVMAQELDLSRWLEAQEASSPPAQSPEESNDHLRYFTPEERAIIEEERASAASADSTTAEPATATTTMPPPAEADQGRLSWVEALKAFGEHLTDSELRALREQLATS